MNKIQGGLLDMDQASAYIGIKKSTLYQLVMRKQIKCYKIGKLNKFKQQDIDLWISLQAQDPI